MPRAALRILAFEPFDAGSHRAVRESISRHSQHKWAWLTRPGRAWKWRMRLGAIELADEAQQRGLLDQSWDVIFTTSLLGAADLRALLPPHLRSVPLVLYMHENQAEYPLGPDLPDIARRDSQFALTNLTSILAADRVIWNSAWNRDSFLRGIIDIVRHAADTTLLKSGEDGVPHLAGRILQRSTIIWPPVEAPEGQAVERGRGDAGGKPPVRVVWPHRWEHDKDPDALLAIARQHSENLNLRWTILGERYREQPSAMTAFQREFADRIDHIGYLPDRADYLDALRRCDWVLSTARHEFFGIAVVEALLAGCLPWLPNRLSYTELLPEPAQSFSPLNPPTDPAAVAATVRAHLQPALAENAVGELDRQIASALQRK